MSRDKGQAPTTKPIDVLILETALGSESVRAVDLAGMWGEDRTRIENWLVRLCRQGLFFGGFGRYYAPRDECIRDYLARRRQAIP